MKLSTIVFSFLFLSLTACSDSGGGSDKGGSPPSDGNNNNESLSEWQASAVGQEGHGGDAIVCFSIPVERALYKVGKKPQNECPPNEPCPVPVQPGQGSGTVWKMTQEGRNSIHSAKPLEQYLAERISSKKIVIDQLNNMPLQDGYERILKPLQSLPAPFNRISDMHKTLGWLHEDGISSEFGLVDINDSGFVGEQEIDKVYCKELQAVVRRDNQLWYDADIIRHFDNAGRVLIQLHEEIYAWGKRQDEINEEIHGQPVHQTSTKTRRLILKLLDQSLSTSIMNENLKTLGFSTMHWKTYTNVPISVGYYMDTETCTQEQQFLKNFFRSQGSDWLKAERLFSTRYLDSDLSWAALELRNNFPDILSKMISLVVRQGGEAFMNEVMRLQKDFEKPEACYGQF